MYKQSNKPWGTKEHKEKSLKRLGTGLNETLVKTAVEQHDMADSAVLQGGLSKKQDVVRAI